MLAIFSFERENLLMGKIQPRFLRILTNDIIELTLPRIKYLQKKKRAVETSPAVTGEINHDPTARDTQDFCFQ